MPYGIPGLEIEVVAHRKSWVLVGLLLLSLVSEWVRATGLSSVKGAACERHSKVLRTELLRYTL